MLVDFGIAREDTAAEHPTKALGTPRFAAPEVLAGAMPSPRSDVFGLAATLWALIAGRPPGFLERTLPGVSREVETALRGGLEPDPQLRVPSAEAFARALGEGIATEVGASLALSVARPSAEPAVLETTVRAAAGVFGAAAASIAFLNGDVLVYESAWGAGAEEIVGVQLEPGTGIATHVVAAGRPEAVARCRDDPRFAREVAARTGYVPNTMLVLPLGPSERPFGVLQILDRLDGEAFGPGDVDRGMAFAELALAALDAHGGDTIVAPENDPLAGRRGALMMR